MAMGHASMSSRVHFLSAKVGQALANMEERAAWANECVCRGIKQGTKAGQVTRRANIEDEAVKPIAGVSNFAELTRATGEVDPQRSLIETWALLRTMIEVVQPPAACGSGRQ